MNKEQFIQLIENSKIDTNGNLYYIEEIGVKEPVEIENDSTHRVYFGTITTICADLLEFIDPDDNSLCDRHFINDDTLECKLVREEVKVKEETCPNPNGEEGICYNFDRLGGRCGCMDCELLDTLPNGMFNEGDPLPGLTKQLNVQHYLTAVDTLMNEYDAFYFQNKYSNFENCTHPNEFTMLNDLLKDDLVSMKALGWIKNCYDCYNVNDYVNNTNSAFSYLKTKIEEVLNERNK